MTRARKNRIVVNLNTLGGKSVDPAGRTDGAILVYDEGTDSYVHEQPEYGGLIEYPAIGNFPATGQAGIIYFTINDNRSYRWDSLSQQYVQYITPMSFSQLENKPITLEGYGIVNAYNKTDIGDPATDYVTIFEAALV